MQATAPKTTLSNVDGDLPVDLQAARMKLGEATGDLDTEIMVALHAATRYCEEYTGRVLRQEATVTDVYPYWPGNVIGFWYNPILSIQAVSYYAPDATTLTQVAASDYRLIPSTNLGSVLQMDDSWSPPSIDPRADAVQVVSVAGYADDPIDARAKQAILLMLPLYFDGNIGTDFANTAKMATALLQQIQWKFYQ